MFNVTVKVSTNYDLEVQAKSKNEATILAYEMFNDVNCGVLNEVTWDVIDVKPIGNTRKEYIVTLIVEGWFDIDIQADDADEAAEMALCASIDCGEIRDSKWEAVSIEEI